MSRPGLPAPLARHLEAVGEAGAEGIAAGGKGAMRQHLAGPGVWLPLRWDVKLVPGRACTSSVRFGKLLLGRRLFEEYRSGRGKVLLGRRSYDGDPADRSVWMLVWTWTFLLAPRAAFSRQDVGTERLGERGARVTFPYETETWEAKLRFSAETGLLERLEGHRAEARDGRLLPWAVDVQRYGEAEGALLPHDLTMWWGGEQYLRLELSEIERT